MKREVIKKLLMWLGISCELGALIGMFALSWQAGITYCIGTVIGTIILIVAGKITTFKPENEQKEILEQLVKVINEVIQHKGYTVGTVEFCPVIPPYELPDVPEVPTTKPEIVVKKKPYKRTKKTKVVK